MFVIEKKLSEQPAGAKGRFAQKLWVTREAVLDIYRRWNPSFTTMEKHTNAFNELFWTNYIYIELFKKIPEDET